MPYAVAMRRDPILRIRLLLGGLAATAVVAAHGLAHTLAGINTGSSTRLIEETNPWLWTGVVAFGLGAVVAGSTRLVLDVINDVHRARLDARSLFACAAPRLFALQASGFIALEIVERWLSGVATLGLVYDPVLLAGLALQVITALVGACLLVILVKTSEHLTRRAAFNHRSARGSAFRAVPRTIPRKARVATGGTGLRGPPLPSSI
jgi:hypothetical protein